MRRKRRTTLGPQSREVLSRIKANIGRVIAKAATLAPPVLPPSSSNPAVPSLPPRPGEEPSPFIEVGRSGLKHTGGYLQEEFLRELQGQRGMRVYREMGENNPWLGVALGYIKTLMAQAEWRVEPAVPAEESDVALARFVDSCRKDMSNTWDDMLAEIGTAPQYGYAPMELVYKRRNGPNAPSSDQRSAFDDGMIGWRKIALRAQESVVRWELDEQGGIQGLYQQPAPDYRERFIPIEKMLLFRLNAEKNNPEGRSLLRPAYWSYYQARRLDEIGAIGAERDLAGLPIFHVPAKMLATDAPTSDQAIVAAFKRIGENLRVDEQACIVMPLAFDDKGNALYKFELVAAAGSKQFDIVRLIEMHELRMLTAVLCAWLKLGHEKIGTQALSSNVLDMFSAALDSIMDGVASVFNNYGIPRLLKLNGIDTDRRPMLVHGQVRAADLEGLGRLLQLLSQAGADVFPDERLLRFILSLAKLPTEHRDELEPRPEPKQVPDPEDDPEDDDDPDDPEEDDGKPKPEDEPAER